MKTLTAITLLFSSLLFTVPAMAGTNHSHGSSDTHKPVSDKKAGIAASKVVNKLAKSKKIGKSWVGIKPNTIRQKTFSRGPEWVVTFKNSKIKDASKQTLYVFLSLGGDYIAANYTGN